MTQQDLEIRLARLDERVSTLYTLVKWVGGLLSGVMITGFGMILSMLLGK